MEVFFFVGKIRSVFFRGNKGKGIFFAGTINKVFSSREVLYVFFSWKKSKVFFFRKSHRYKVPDIRGVIFKNEYLKNI